MCTFQVLAVDKGSPVMTGEAHVTVLIKDANNKNPVFTQEFYLTTVAQGEHLIRKLLL